MEVKGHHPLAEVIARKLHGIDVVDPKERLRMANRAAAAAVEYHKAEVERLTGIMQQLYDTCGKPSDKLINEWRAAMAAARREIFEVRGWKRD